MVEPWGVNRMGCSLWKRRRHLSPHIVHASMESWRVVMARAWAGPRVLGMATKMFESSAKKEIFAEMGRDSGRSAMNAVKRKAEMMDPCGIPESVEKVAEVD